MINNISSGHYSSMMQGAYSSRLPSAEKIAENLITAADSDDNGIITKSEFTSMLASESSETNDSVSGLFSQMDTDGSDSISIDEANQAVSSLLEQLKSQRMSDNSMAPPPPPKPEELFASADSDESGGLSVEEFTQALSRKEGDEDKLEDKFVKADTDGDDIVTQEELQTAIENAPPKRGRKMSDGADTSNASAEQTDNISRLVNSLLQQYQENSSVVTSAESLSITA